MRFAAALAAVAALAGCRSASETRAAMPTRSELRQAWTAGLELAGSDRAYAATLDGKLHVFAPTATGRAEHVALSARGEISTLPSVGVDVTGVVPCGGALLVAGLDDDERPLLAIIDAAGGERERMSAPSVAPAIRGPFPLCFVGVPTVVWETSTDGASTLWTARAVSGALAAPRAFPLGDVTVALGVAAAGATPVLVRLAGVPPRLELVAPDRSARAPLAAGSEASLVAAGAGADRAVIAWLGGSGGGFQAVDAALSPLGAEGTLPPLPADAGTLSRLEIYAGPALAVIATTARGPRGIAGGAARMFVGMGGAWQALPLRPDLAEAAGWVGETLIVVRGGARAEAVGFSFSR